ncbi:helix-turn-helix transcriptional regulator [Leisingera sp. MMG026]|uniref:helix-turn-helix domain-containing protein n=1 Tax=Leisingera sp. MMG026 TaxID=2909982 RepID=UPI001F437EED|nr:helix-turn-helix transcriptional regulator [Leisingera sp. MMG026]MCF6433720.1 helix-turn-helix domain-containing protein [Leisingera sp. MMG026]
MAIRRLVGRNLKRFREEAGFSQEALAFECGLHRTYVSGVERGVRNPTIVVLEKLAEPLGIPSWRLLMPEDEQA